MNSKFTEFQLMIIDIVSLALHLGLFIMGLSFIEDNFAVSALVVSFTTWVSFNLYLAEVEFLRHIEKHSRC